MFVSSSFQMKICYNSYGFLGLNQKNKYHSMISVAFLWLCYYLGGVYSHRIVEYSELKGPQGSSPGLN